MTLLQTLDTLLFKCPKCLWWIGAAKPAAYLTKDELHETTFDLKCHAECGWEGRLTRRDAFPCRPQLSAEPEIEMF
jgi:hypothetical protein